MAQRKYVILIPIVTTLLLFASISGILANAFALETQDSFSRSFSVGDLSSGEVVVNSIPMPNEIQNPEMRFAINYFDDFDDNESRVSIFLSDVDPGFNRQNRTVFENSTYFSENIIASAYGVRHSQTLYPNSNDDTLYIIIGTESSEEISFNVFITIQEVDRVSQTDTARVLGVIFSALLTALFFFSSLYLWMEYFERIPRKILTDELNEKFDYYIDKALSWELFVAGFGVLFSISGYSQLLVSGDFGLLIVAIICIGVVYHNFSKRQEIEEQIRGVLVSHGEISLDELAELIVQDKSDTKKALLDAIMYSNLPAKFDFKTEMVTYDPSAETKSPETVVDPDTTQSFQVASTEVQSPQVDQDETQSKRPLPKCAYCDTEAISHDAQFCHSCGASMSATK